MASEEAVEEAAVSRSEGGAYFGPQTSNEVISSGCQLFDCMLGGGYAENRIINIIGGSGSAKTGLAIEACANFNAKYPDGHIYYAETEAAFDLSYAEVLGMPVEEVNFPENILTVEDVFEHIDEVVLKSQEDGSHALYIIDSLDALSDRAEMEREIDKDTYGAAKAKKLSELFRRLTQKLEGSNVTVIVISQVRDNMNAAPFGSKKTRSGGKALEFYCTQIVWIDRTGPINKTIKGEKRPIGTTIHAKTSKNKIAAPFREADIHLYFNYGIYSEESNLNWLYSVNQMKRVFPGYQKVKDALKDLEAMEDEDFFKKCEEIDATVRTVWDEIEREIAPTRRKYSKHKE